MVINSLKMTKDYIGCSGINYGKVVLQGLKYSNQDNKAIVMLSPDESERILVCTVNPSMLLKENTVCIKDWSENEGVENYLIRCNIIEPEPVDYWISGLVTAGIFKLTNYGEKLFIGEPEF